MALVIKDRVRETTTVVGTGDITLDGAFTGYVAFSSVMGIGDTTYYAIAGQGTNEWEVGLGTYISANTLARTTVYASSNAGALVSFSAGTKDVFIDYPAYQANTKSFVDGAFENITYNPSSNVYTSGSYVASPNLHPQGNVQYGVTFSTDGLNMYLCDDTNNSVDQYSLSRPFDVTSASYLRTRSVSLLATLPYAITFDPTGTYMYLLDDGANRVVRYVLTTPWDISTTTSGSSFSLGTTNPGFGIQFKPDGTQMFLSNQSNLIYTYNLSTPWVISSGVTLVRSNAVDSSLRGFRFSQHGLTRITVGASGAPVLRRRTVSAAWDTAALPAANQTITLSSANFPLSTYGFAYGITMNDSVVGVPEGTRLFVFFNGTVVTRFVMQFQLSAAYDISLMASPLFDITNTQSKQVALVPGTSPVYIGRLGVPPNAFAGMTKQVTVTAPTALINNPSYLNTMTGGVTQLAAGDVFQVTYDGTAWDVTDLRNTLKLSLFNLANKAAGFVAFNPSGNTMEPRTMSPDLGITITNQTGGGNPVFKNVGIRTANQRSDTDTWYHLYKPTKWSVYGNFYGSSRWLGQGGSGTYNLKQIGGGCNNTGTPDAFYWDKNTDPDIASQMPDLSFPWSAENRNSYLRRYYWLKDRWWQRQLIYAPESVWGLNARAVRSMSELCLGQNWNDTTYEDVPANNYTYGYAIPFAGDASQNPTGTRVTGNVLISGTVSAPTILSQAVTTTTEVKIHLNGRSFVFTAWTADGAVSMKVEGGGYTSYEATLTFAANTTFYYNYWAVGDQAIRTFVKVFFSNTATTDWQYQIGEDAGGTVWRAYIKSADRGNYVGGFWRDTVGFVFQANRLERLWSIKSMALPLTTNGVARNFSIQARFRIDDITTIDQNVFWIANSAAPANPNGIRVRVNDGVIDRRLSITLGTTANAAATGNIVDKLRAWQFNNTGEWVTVTFTWNPLDATFPGRLFVNDVLVSKTNSQPFGATTAWFNIGSTASGSANGFTGRVDYLTVMPECWGAYIPQGSIACDYDAGDAGWVNANNNGGQTVGFNARNRIGRSYIRGTTFPIGSYVYADRPWDGAETFTLTGDIVNGSDTVTLSKTTAGFQRNSGYFLVTAAGIPTTLNVYANIQFGDKTFVLRDRSDTVVNATATTNGVTLTFVRINGGIGAGLVMPDNAIFVAKGNNVSLLLTNEWAGVNSGATTASCVCQDFTFTSGADAAINDYFYTQNSAANNTAARNIQSLLALGMQLTITGTGITATSATIDNCRVTGLNWDAGGTGIHQVMLSRNRDAAATAGATMTLRMVPNASCLWDVDRDYLGGDSAGNYGVGGSDSYQYSPDIWFGSSLEETNSFMVLYDIGQIRNTRVTPLGAIYDSGIFKATATPYVRQMYLGQGCIGYLINYGSTGDYNGSTVNPVVTAIAYAATNGMNSDGITLTVTVNNFYRVIILPLGVTLKGDF